MPDFNTDKLWGTLVLLDRRALPVTMSYWDEPAQAFIEVGATPARGVLYEYGPHGPEFVLSTEGDVIGVRA